MDTKVGAVLVVGGGIAGMQASLDLAENGLKVYLVETGPKIGGTLNELDCIMCKICHRYFPETEGYEPSGCGICLYPKILEEINWNKNIEVLTNHFIERVEKRSVNFIVRLAKGQKPNMDPVFPASFGIQAGRKQNEEITVGGIVLATGFKDFDPTPLKAYGYGTYPNVVASLDFEKMISPYRENIEIGRPSDGIPPKKIAFVQCIGSRDKKCGNEYCSSVCCMYAIREAVIAQNSLEDLESTIFFMDIRAFGKESEEYYNKGETEHGISFTRCRVSMLEEDPETKNLLVTYVKDGKRKQEIFDMVVLSVGFEPPKYTAALAEKLGIELNKYGFCATKPFSPLETSKSGIFAAGAFSGPMDISETVVQVSGAAALAAAYLTGAENSLVSENDYPPERDIAEAEPRIGVFVCECGMNIASVVDVPTVVEYARALPGVVHAEWNSTTCSGEVQNKMVETIKAHKLNRVVVASGTPRTHEGLFQDMVRSAGLNPYLLEIANIRDQCSLVHQNEPESATEKAKDLVGMAVAKVRLNEPMPVNNVEIIQKALVLGGGVSGMTAALGFAARGYETYLIERKGELGGNLQNIYYSMGAADPQALLRSLLRQVAENRSIDVVTNAEVELITGRLGNFKTTVSIGNVKRELYHGVLVIATGSKRYEPTEYLYGLNERVLTQTDLERKLAAGDFSAKQVVMIQCVGSRDGIRNYCSRTCCGEAVKNALKIKETSPETDVFILYKDIRTYGLKEQYYKKAAENDIVFIRYDDDNKPVVYDDAGLTVRILEPLIKKQLLFEPDMLVLSAGWIPQAGTKELADMLTLPRTRHGFFLEEHTKYRPVDFTIGGIYLCGKAHSPKYVQESIAQAQAVVARGVGLLNKRELVLTDPIATVNPDDCAACLTCVRLCAYGAPRITDEGVAEILVENCKGCGICVGECPGKAIQLFHYKDDQLLAQCGGTFKEVTG